MVLKSFFQTNFLIKFNSHVEIHDKHLNVFEFANEKHSTTSETESIIGHRLYE